MEPRLAEFIHLFNTARFYEAHEVLENLWLETSQPVKDFYKGLIQCAVSFAHIQRNNRSGAASVHERSRGHLLLYSPVYQGIDVSELLKECECFFSSDATHQRFPKIRTLE